MSEIDLKAMMEGMRGQLEQDEAAGKMAGLTVSDLQDAMSHPLASASVADCMAAELQSVKQGEPAPDFTLPWLPGSAGNADPTLRLSSHFEKRPVALIFGSYT